MTGTSSGVGRLHPDVARIREDFPALAQQIRRKPPIYLDNACTTLRPAPVIEAVAGHMRSGTACHGRANHRFGRDATDALARGRDAVRRFIGAEMPEEVVFVRNTTEAINLVAGSLRFVRGDVVLTTDMEHNSNLLPWQRLARERGVQHVRVPVDFEGGLDMDVLRQHLRRGVRLVAVFHVSNMTGIELPVADICAEAHKHGALVLVDGAQAVQSRTVDVGRMDADFYAFSFHKMMGPTGVGVLWGREPLLQQMAPFHVGGDTVEDVTYDDCTWAPLPSRFEAGVANVDGVVGATAAIEYLAAIGQERIHEHIVALNALATEKLLRIPRVSLVGPRDPAKRGGILNFVVEGIDSRGVARVLDERANVMVRFGKHCVHAWYNATGASESVRASFGVYNTPEEIVALARTVANVASLLD